MQPRKSTWIRTIVPFCCHTCPEHHVRTDQDRQNIKKERGEISFIRILPLKLYCFYISCPSSYIFLILSPYR